MVKPVPLLIVTGPVGVGKTSVGYAISESFDSASVAHAFVDVDGLTRFFPRPEDDPYATSLATKNLAAVWSNFQAAGATCLIVADVIESCDDLDRIRSAVDGAAILLVRLFASDLTLERRLRGRESDSNLGWYLRRAKVLSEEMHEAGLEDLLVDTDGKSIDEITREILDRTGWPD